MIGEAPKSPYEGYIVDAGELTSEKRSWDKFGLVGLKPDAPDEMKISFERFKTNDIKHMGVLRIFGIEMDDPYYTWEGKIVERSSLEGRELPLAD